MEIPALVQEHLGGEELQTGIMLGDDDVLCLTPTRLLLYRAEGLLSDESVTEYPHEVERLHRNDGRRKTKFVFEYVEEKGSLTVPNDVADDVLELILQGILTTERILGDEEAVVGAFRFSELTLIVAEERVVKHVGNAVWEEDFEMYAFEDLTGLAFQQASVATEIVMRVGGRPQRIKTPNDKARIVEKTLQKAVFEYFEVTSMSELQAHFDAEADEEVDDADATTTSDDLTFDSEIKPLGDDASASPFSDADDVEADNIEADAGDSASITDAESLDPSGEGPVGSVDEHLQAETTTESDQTVTEDDLRAVEDQLAELTTAVDRQNELLKKQHAAMKQLIEELRQGR